MVLCTILAALNLMVTFVTCNRVVSAENAARADCILVLGSGINDDGTPGRMLSRRLDTAIELYRNGAAPKLLMSGDHSSDDYDEVNAMRRYAIEHGVPVEDIIMDHTGFCTYDSMVRAKQIFGCESVVIVSQRYHLYRAVWNADMQGMEAQGVAADMYDYGWRYTAMLYIREALARVKDVMANVIRLPALGNADLFGGNAEDAFSAICCVQKPRFTSSKPSIFALASDEK